MDVRGDSGTRPLPPRTLNGPETADEGVAANARLTSATAAVLLVLLAVEGATVLRVRSLLTVHVFVGMLLVPPVLVKMGSTAWRFVRYYRGSPAYRRKGLHHCCCGFSGRSWWC